jgi:phospholipase/lecithinase/hemolysin
MRIVNHFAIGVLLLGLAVLPVQAAYTSLYVFGDGLSTTTNNTAGPAQDFYGGRFSNGRVWVEVLAQRQGINISNNWSYFNDNSGSAVTNIKNFPATISSNALVVLWVNNSDLYDLAVNDANNPSVWPGAINQDQTNHLNAISELHAKGVRTLIMPSPVDVGEVPFFEYDEGYPPALLSFIRQECIAYNVAFSNTLIQARVAFPDMTIYEPNFFALLDNVLTNAASYGLTNAVINQGENIDALEYLPNPATNGPGTNFVYWDPTDPSAKFHEIMADTVQQFISPVQVTQIKILGSPAGYTTNQLTVVNVPMGLNGYVDGTTNLGQAPVLTQQQPYYSGWVTVTNFNSTNLTQTISFIAPPLPPVELPAGNGIILPGGTSGSGGTSSTNNTSPGVVGCYRLRFPLTWNWP